MVTRRAFGKLALAGLPAAVPGERRIDRSYAWKQLSANMSDGEFEYVFNVAELAAST
jgi:hypothetical protein